MSATRFILACLHSARDRSASPQRINRRRGTRMHAGAVRAVFVALGGAVAIGAGSMSAVAADRAWSAAPASVPAEALAWYRFDPTRFVSPPEPGAASPASGGGGGATAAPDENPAAPAPTPAGGLLPAALLVLQRSGVIEDDVLPVVHALVGASIAGSVPHSVCLLDLDLAYDDTAEDGVRVLTAQAVLTIETGRNHHTLLNALDGILGHYAATAEGGRQSLFTLPDGRQAGRFESTAWGTWRTLEWTSQPDAFLVGLGTGALERWISIQQSGNGATARPTASGGGQSGSPRPIVADEPLMELHRSIVDLMRPARGATFLEIWLNLERMHTRMPDILAQGRVREQLVAWQLDNARNWMLHGRWSDRFLLFDLTWQRRSESRTDVAHRSLTVDRMPAELQFRVPRTGDFLIVAPMDHAGAFTRTVGAYRGLLSGERRAAFDTAYERWSARHRRILPEVLRSFEPWVVVTNVPAPPAPIPGACTVYFELRDPADPRVVARQLDGLLESFVALPAPEELGDARIVRDERQDLSYLQVERTGLLRAPAWGWAGRVLVAGWGPPVVVENRRLLTGP